MAKSRMYQLYELRDEIKRALLNSNTVEQSQRKLVEIIIKGGHEKEFKDLIKGMTQDWKDYEHTRLVLNTRLGVINELIAMYEKRDNNSELVAEIVTKVIEAFGATNPEKDEKNEQA